MEFHLIHNFREFSAELFCQQKNPDFFIGQSRFQSGAQLFSLVHHHTVHPGEPHARLGVDVVTDQIHFHKAKPLCKD